jgi:hypothetical protein
MHPDFSRIVEACRLKLEAWDVRRGMSVGLLCNEETLAVLRQAYFKTAVAIGAARLRRAR